MFHERIDKEPIVFGWLVVWQWKLVSTFQIYCIWDVIHRVSPTLQQFIGFLWLQQFPYWQLEQIGMKASLLTYWWKGPEGDKLQIYYCSWQPDRYTYYMTQRFGKWVADFKCHIINYQKTKDLDTCWSKLCSHCILQRRTILGGARMNDASWTYSCTELSLGCLLKIDGPTPLKHLWYPCSWTALST